jgi:hypothetical protein
VGCSGKSGAGSAGVPVAPATEQDLRNDLLRLHRDQEAFRIRHGTYAFALQDLDFRVTDGVSMTLRRVSAQSYYAVAGLDELECVIGGWGVRTDLPINIQTSLIAPGTPSCTEG